MLYFRRFSYLKRSLDYIFLRKYQIPDIGDSVFDVAASRLFYVQNREDSSLSIGLRHTVLVIDKCVY